MTKQELIKSAVALVTAYPQTTYTGDGQTLFTTSAEVYYSIKLPAAMEAFIYGFGVSSFSLSNPTTSDKDPDYKLFSVPPDVGFIFTVCKESSLPAIESIIGIKGLRRLNSLHFTKLPGNRIQLRYPNDYQNDLAIGYITKTPDPAVMSASFIAYLIHDIAQQLALKSVQQRSLQQLLQHQALINKRIAQKFALDNSSLYEYHKVALTDAVYINQPEQEQKTLQTQIRDSRTYFRGI